MTITSVGYMGQVSDAEWAQMAPHTGMRFWVAGPGDLAPAVTSPSARQVRVGAGTAGGSGVMDVLDAPESVTLAPLGSGSRVDVVCLRRSWTPTGTPTGTTSVVVVSGSSLTVALGALRRTPGTISGDDQPLAAFQVVASGAATSVTLLEDLRVWGANGGLVAASTGALVVLDEPGTTVQIGSATWARVVAGGSASWVSSTRQRVVVGAGQTVTVGTPSSPVVQYGSAVLTSDQAGFTRLTWPETFPGGLVTVLLTSGDDQAAPGMTMTPSGNTAQWGSQAVGDRTGVVYVLRDASGAVATGRRHRVSYAAVGW